MIASNCLLDCLDPCWKPLFLIECVFQSLYDVRHGIHCHVVCQLVVSISSQQMMRRIAMSIFLDFQLKFKINRSSILHTTCLHDDSLLHTWLLSIFFQPPSNLFCFCSPLLLQIFCILHTSTSTRGGASHLQASRTSSSFCPCFALASVIHCLIDCILTLAAPKNFDTPAYMLWCRCIDGLVVMGKRNFLGPSFL